MVIEGLISKGCIPVDGWGDELNENICIGDQCDYACENDLCNENVFPSKFIIYYCETVKIYSIFYKVC